MCCVSPGSYEGWEGGSFPCIRVKKNRDSLPRLVLVIMRIIRNQHLQLSKRKFLLSNNSCSSVQTKNIVIMYSSTTSVYYLLPVSVNRISVRVRGGETQGPAAGLDGMNLGLIRDLGAAFFDSHCELNDKTSSPFSSNRTMFETEEVR